MLMWKLEQLLAERGLPVTWGESASGEPDGWLQIDVPEALITIEPRPFYCDRGNYIVKVFPRGDLALSLDEHDGFPRYYFGVLACADEILAWMHARKIVPASERT